MSLVTRFGLIPRRVGLTLQEFQAHWRDPHAGLGAQLPGVQRYWQNHRIPPPAGPPLPWPGFDACSEIDAESLETHLAMRRSPVMLGPILDDEPKFLDRPKRAAVWTERIAASGELGGVRLLTFLVRNRDHSRQDLMDVALGAVDDGGDSQGAAGSGYELFVAPAQLPDELVSAFDAVEARWFADAEAATRYLSSERCEADRAAIAGVVSGTERLLAEVNFVVGRRSLMPSPAAA